MGEWKEYKLGDIAEFKTGKLNSNAAIEGGKYPFFTCSPETLRINDYAFDCEALLLAGNNAEGVFSLKYYNGKFNAYQRTYVITIPKNINADYKYLFYNLRTQLKELQNISYGSATKFLTLTILNEIDIKLPEYHEQKSIASILSSLDDKIDLLHRQNKTLEALAETLFRQWFVEGAEEGWAVCRLLEVCSLITDGKHGDCQNETNSGYYFISAKDVKDGKIFYDCARQITKSDFEETHRRTNLTAGDIVITNSGTIGRMAIIRDIPETRKTTFQKSVAILKPKREKITSKFLYCLLQANHNVIAELAGGTTQQNLLIGDLKEFEFKCPSNLLIEKFDVMVTPCFEKMFSNDAQIRTLTRLRDTLLPKLMSGEVRV